MRTKWFLVLMGLSLAGSCLATVIMPRWGERRPVREWPLQFESEKVRVEIRDEVDTVGRIKHTRFIVEKARQGGRLEKKKARLAEAGIERTF